MKSIACMRRSLELGTVEEGQRVIAFGVIIEPSQTVDMQIGL